MSDFPEKTCTIDRLIRHPRLTSAALAGLKTEQRRDGLYAYPGESFILEGVSFTVTDVKQQALGNMSDADAKAEGYPDLNSYRNIILSMHKGMAWNPDSLVWVHCFKRTRE